MQRYKEPEITLEKRKEIFELLKAYLPFQLPDIEPDHDDILQYTSSGPAKRPLNTYKCRLSVDDTSTKDYIIHLKPDVFDPDPLLYRQNNENYISYKLSKLGIGPTVFGMKDGMRIEEYINTERITNHLALTDEFNKAMAYKLVEFHTIKLPVNKTKPQFEKLADRFKDKRWMESTHVDSLPNTYSFELLRFLSSLDVESEMEFCRRCIDEIEGKQVFIHGDIDIQRILLRKDIKDLNESVMLISYEMADYGERASDMYNWIWLRHSIRGPSGDVIRTLPPKEDKIKFLKYYLEFTRVKTNEDELESIDEMLIELEVYGLVWMLMRILMQGSAPPQRRFQQFYALQLPTGVYYQQKNLVRSLIGYQ